jgi:hypothetical protein
MISPKYKSALSFAIFFILFYNGYGQPYVEKATYKYSALYYSKEKKISTNETIYLIITGDKWRISKKQNEAIWSYQNTNRTTQNLDDRFTIGVTNMDTTGILEDDKRVFMHPPKLHQYAVTETAPFPDFKKNVSKGESYTSTIESENGIKAKGAVIKVKYKVESTSTENNTKTWSVKSQTKTKNGTNKLLFIYNEKSGSTYLVYEFYNKDMLILKLIE